MTDPFRQWLGERGARWHGAVLADFGDPASELQHAERGAVVTDLSHLALLAVSGADAERFLDGQFTCRIAGMPADEIGLGGYCDPKGRVIAVFRWLRKGDAWLLCATPTTGPLLRDRLAVYLLRAAVRLEDAAPMVAVFAVAGEGARRVLDDAGFAVPEAGRRIERDATVVIRAPGPRERFEVYTCPSERRRSWERLEAAGARPVGVGCWELFELRAGVAWLTAETSGQFIPQMLDLDRVGAVSFDKGCYPGQEVVSRVHHLGEVKRRLQRLRSPEGTLAPPGSAVLEPGTGRSAGTVLASCPTAGGHSEVLAVVSTARAGQPLCLEGLAQSPLEPLPFDR